MGLFLSIVENATFDESLAAPVVVYFNSIVSFNDGATLPTEEELLELMFIADYENYIQNYVWNGALQLGEDIFFEVQSVHFSAVNESISTAPAPQNDGGAEAEGQDYETFAPTIADAEVGQDDEFFFPLSNPIIAPEASVGIVLNETRLTYGYFSGFARAPTGDEYEYLITQTSEFFTNTAMSAFPNFMNFQSERKSPVLICIILCKHVLTMVIFDFVLLPRQLWS